MGILPDQLLIGGSYHALCATGYRGMDSIDFLKQRKKHPHSEKSEYNAALVSIFEKTDRFIYLGSPIIVQELKRQGFNTDQRNTEEAMWETIKNLPHIVWWQEYCNGDKSGDSRIWAMHRKHYQQSEDVDWKRYAIEILRFRKRETFYGFIHRIPYPLRHFISWKTKEPIDLTLLKIDGIQLFWNRHGTLSVRLKK